MASPTNHQQALIELLETYHDLNTSWVERLEQPPTPIEFLQIIKRNRPVVIHNALYHWPAITKWNADYLRCTINSHIAVAETPLGNADSVVTNEVDKREYFVKPHTTQEPFADFLEYLQKDTPESSDIVKYAQSQNDNLHGEFSCLLPDIIEEIPWASALGAPEAINLWIGNSRSTSALHKDNYENLYCMISGIKKFVLISPLEVACVRERTLPSATYKHNGKGGFDIIPDDPPSEVPCWPTLDPDDPTRRPTRFWDYCRPLRVELNRGDILYLPAMWYHKVSQECSPGSVCIAVNYWYDMDYQGPFYSLCQFVRSSALILSDEDGAAESNGNEE
ncbi:cupin-like domain-containing protein [Kalaharituber pfeilii]|nr:cupin-like domain-containing protein [Kalaharituber pfeilii]